jgi:hypothetical protein
LVQEARASRYGDDQACDVCGHRVNVHNNIQGCPLCDCMASQGEANYNSYLRNKGEAYEGPPLNEYQTRSRREMTSQTPSGKHPHKRTPDATTVCVVLRDRVRSVHETPSDILRGVFSTDEACDAWFEANDPTYSSHSHVRRLLA